MSFLPLFWQVYTLCHVHISKEDLVVYITTGLFFVGTGANWVHELDPIIKNSGLSELSSAEKVDSILSYLEHPVSILFFL